MKKSLFTLLFCFCVGFIFGQTNGDYRTRRTGNWNQIGRWEVFNNGWKNLSSVGAGPYRNILPTNASGVITIRHNLVITASISVNQLVILTGIQLSINAGRTLTVVDDFTQTPIQVNTGGVLRNLGTIDLQTLLSSTPCQIDGTLVSTSVIQISNAILLSFNSGSSYRHLNVSGGNVPLATWNVNSTCLIEGLSNANPLPPNNLGQAFGNFTWNTPSMGATTMFSLGGALQTVNGNLTFISTGSTPREVRFDNGGGGYSLAVGGNLVIQSGTITLTENQTSATSITVGGSLSMSGGTLTLGTLNNSAIDILLNGNFQKTAGTIARGTGTGAGTIHFDGGLQTYTNNAAIASAINFAVESGSNLNLGTAALTGTGTFLLNSGGTIQVGSVDAAGAIQSGTTGGNIRVSGTRTYQSGATIIYNGAAEQAMASGHPSAVNTTIDNSNNVRMLANITISGALTLTDGVLLIESFTLTLEGAYAPASGTMGIAPGSSLVINGSGAFGDLLLFHYAFPSNPMNNLTINRPGGTIVHTNTNLIVSGTFTQTAGTYAFSTFFTPSLTLNGPFTQAAGTSITGASNASFIIGGSGAIPASINVTGSLNLLRMNRTGGTYTPAAPLTVTNLNLRDGTVAPSGLITMATGGTITREFGIVNAAVSAQTSYNVVYAGAFNITTGLELPTNATALDNLTLNNTFNITNPQPPPGPHAYILTLATPVFVNGSLTITEGTFATANNAVSIGNDLTVATDGIFQPGQSPITFNGSSPQTLTSSSPLTIFNLAVTQTSASTLDILSAVDIENGFSVNSSSAVNAGTNLLRLLSTPANTANVAPLASGASITGSVIVQRYLPKAVAVRNFHYMSSPVTNSSMPDWDLELPIAKAYRWNEPTTAYVIYSLAGALPSGRGFAVDVSSPATFTYDTRGTLGQGDILVPVTAKTSQVDGPDGWNLIGNPYPSAIDWDNIALPAGIYNAIYFTDNFNNSGQGSGVQSVTYVDGVGTPTGYAGQIAQGQAFWVKATANTTLTFTEAAKISPTNVQFYREGETPNVLRITMEGQGVKEEAVVRLREGATDRFDGKYDAHKFINSPVSLTTLTTDNVKAVINAFGKEDCNRSIPLVAEGISTGNYQFSFVGMESFGAQLNVSFIDQIENKTIDLRREKEYTFSVTDQNLNALSTRFKIVLSSSMEDVVITAEGPTLISSYEVGNQWYLDDEILEGETTDRVEASQSGIYTVKVTDGTCSSASSREKSVTASEQNTNLQQEINIFPNPTQDKVFVEVKSFNNNVKAVMTNAAGVEIETKALVGENGIKAGEFDLIPYATGIYNIRISVGSKVVIKKIAKVK